MEINPGFCTKSKITRKRWFDEGPDDTPTESHSAEELSRIIFFADC
jgi:hypothetical protein